jgi:hypothetical protein
MTLRQLAVGPTLGTGNPARYPIYFSGNQSHLTWANLTAHE